jgi:phage baseplate assembly protein W
MLPLSANPDFKDLGESKSVNPYYDINGDILSEKVEVYGSDALDQAIETVLCTEPYERMFNPSLCSPFYKILFENHTQVNAIMPEVYDQIEYWVPVKIYRDKVNLEIDAANHCIRLQIPYISNDGTIRHIFSRVISK